MRAALKLLCEQTGQSIMLFEETVPPGTKSWFHLHRDSDEVAWVLEGEISFRIGELVRAGARPSSLGVCRPEPALTPVDGSMLRSPPLFEAEDK